MIAITLKVIKKKKDYGWSIKFPQKFEVLSSQQKLDLLQDALHDINKKWKEIDENY
jgi:hypothetical protein